MILVGTTFGILGGVIGVIFAAFMFSYIEKKLRKIIPASPEWKAAIGMA